MYCVEVFAVSVLCLNAAVNASTPNDTEDDVQFPRLQIQPARTGDFAFLKCREPTDVKQIPSGSRWKFGKKLIAELLGIHEYITPELKERLQIHHGSTLKLIEIRSSDRGLYTCSVQTGLNEWTDMNQIFLNVQEAPTIVQSSVRRTVVELGANVTIFCQWIASPRAVVTWYRGLPIPRETDCCADANVRLMPASAIRNLKPRTSQLVFHNFRDKDMDEYTCRVKNSLGTASRTMGVLVQGRAPITMKPKNQTVKEGVSSVLFHCRVISETEFTHYNWLKNGRHLSLYPGLQHRYKIFSNGTLLLLSINRSDMGLYTCVADDESNANQQEFRSDPEVMSSHRRPTHRLGKKGEGFSYFPYPGLQWTVSAKLDVHFPPEAHLAKMQPIYLGFNGPGRLPCTVTANPRVEFIEWEKIRNVTTTRSHKPLSSLNTSVVSSPENAIQRVWPILIGVDQLGVRKDPVSTEMTTTYWYEWDAVNRADTGTYRCRGWNHYQWGSWSDEIILLVRQFPRFTVKPPTSLLLSVNSVILLRCAADGDPKPTINWVELRKGTIVRELPKSATVTRKSYLRLKVTESMHTGLVLYCVASNLIGRVMTPVNVTARHSAPVIGSQLSYSPVEMAHLHVQPQSFGAWLTWDWKTRPIPLISATDADQGDRSKLAEHFPSTSSSSPSPTCHTVVYHRIVRTQEKWISFHAKSNDFSRVWLGGLIPEEFYAFRLAIWCDPAQYSALSSVICAQTESWPEETDTATTRRLHGSLTSGQGDMPISETDDLAPERPIGLKVLFTPTDSELPGTKTNSSAHAAWLALQWIPQKFTHHPHFVPILFYRVEYQLVQSDVMVAPDERCQIPAFQGSINQWASLAPVRAPEHRFQFHTLTDSQLATKADNQKCLQSCFTKLYFRVRSYSMTAGSEPSSILYVSQPLLDQILPVLHETIVREQQTFRNMTDTFTLDEPIAEIAAISDSSNTTSTNGIILDVPERFWYGLSYSLLAVLILCAIFLTAYAVRQTLQRKGKKQRVLDRSENQEVLNVQSNESSKFILTNQIRPTQLDESIDDPSGFVLYTKSEDVKRLKTKEACLVHARCSTPNWNNLRQFTQERRCSPLLSRSYMSREDDTHEACNQITVGTMSPHQHTVWTDIHKPRCSSSKPARHPFERRFPELVEIKPGGTSSGETVKHVDLLSGNMPHLEITSEVNSTYQPVVKQTSRVSNNPSNYSTLSWIGTMEPTRPTTVQSRHMDSPPANPHAAYVVLPVNPINQELKGETLQISCVPFGTECISLYAAMDPNNQTPTSSILVEDSILSISHEHPIDTCLLMQTPVWHGSHIRTNPS